MREVETRLRELRESAEWPETPDLASVVVARLEATRAEGARAARAEGAGGARSAGAARTPFPRGRRRLALALSLALLVPAGGAVAFPAARDDVLDWLGLKGAEVRRATELPPARVPTPDELGRVVSVSEAERAAGFRLLLPIGLGDPRELRYDEATGFVTAVYDGVLVAQARGALTRELVEKVVDTRTGVRRVEVGGEPGVYVDGPHAYLYERPGGVIGEDRPRRAPRALVFNRGDVVVRIEGPPLDRALALARGLR